MSNGSLTAMAVTVHRNPALSAGRETEARDEVLGSLSSLAVLVVALVLGTVFSDTVNDKALLLLFLTGPAEHLLLRRWRRRPEQPDGRGSEAHADVRSL